MITRILSMMVLVLAAAGCGGGGGGGGAQAVVSHPIRSITFPIGTVSVTRTAGQIVAGGSATFRVTVPDPQPVSVVACLGSGWETSTAFSATPGSSGTWLAPIDLPDPLPPATSVLLRLTMADGEIYESGLDELGLDGL